MTGPIDTGYQAFTDAIAAGLVSASLIPNTQELQIDPEGAFAPSGDETVLVCAAAVLKLETKAVQQFLGSGSPRYAVERQVRVELAAAGPDPVAVRTALTASATQCAAIVATNFQLGGAVERLTLNDQQDDDLPPNGAKVLLTFTLRVRAADPLGLS